MALVHLQTVCHPLVQLLISVVLIVFQYVCSRSFAYLNVTWNLNYLISGCTSFMKVWLSVFSSPTTLGRMSSLTGICSNSVYTSLLVGMPFLSLDLYLISNLAFSYFQIVRAPYLCCGPVVQDDNPLLPGITFRLYVPWSSCPGLVFALILLYSSLYSMYVNSTFFLWYQANCSSCSVCV